MAGFFHCNSEETARVPYAVNLTAQATVIVKRRIVTPFEGTLHRLREEFTANGIHINRFPSEPIKIMFRKIDYPYRAAQPLNEGKAAKKHRADERKGITNNIRTGQRKDQLLP